MIPTFERVERNTAEAVAQEMEARLRRNVGQYLHADEASIQQRLDQLDREWNVERFIETEAPLMILAGVGLGLAHDRRWFLLSAMAASMVLLHNLQGWYPLLPLLRRMGVRTQNEIEQERMAMRIIRGDHRHFETDALH